MMAARTRRMAVLHQEVDAMLFERNRIGLVIRYTLNDLDAFDLHLVAAGSTLVGANLSADDHAGFLGQALNRLPDLRRDLGPHDHALNQAGSVTEDGEQQLAALSQVVEPA